MTLAEIFATYEGSDGDATKALYERLDAIGPIGIVATNLFRACKNSARAKVYRGGQRGRGSYRRMAYGRKSWAMDNLTRALNEHAAALSLVWGWGVDAAQSYHNDVLYIDLPTGQVSFHTSPRGIGPDYPGSWDGAPGASPQRVCAFCAQLLAAAAADPCRNACQERCAGFGEPSCYEIWPTVRQNMIARGDADPGAWKPCTECLREVGVEVVEPIDPAAVVRPLL